MNKMKKVLLWGSGTFATLGAMTGVALAQGNTFDVGNVNPIPVPSNVDLPVLINRVINWALAILGVVAVIYLIYGGVVYLTAGGDAEKAGKGRTVITNAIIGIVIIAVSLILYNFVIRALLGNSASTGGLTPP